MEGNSQRFVAQRRKNGRYWCVIDHTTGECVVTSDSTLDSLSEEEAKRISDRLNQATGKPRRDS